MAPTTEEELKIRLYGEPSKLGPAEQFIRNIVEVPFAYERIEALLFMVCLQEEVTSTFESFSTIEVRVHITFLVLLLIFFHIIYI